MHISTLFGKKIGMLRGQANPTKYPPTWEKKSAKEVKEQVENGSCTTAFAVYLLSGQGEVGGTVACESALRSAETVLSQVRALPSAPRPDRGP
ncbi:hypothetical protein PoB_005443200 [Plakobranchus ocellatus]|uniref:Uncharacterized protein n=1 Tax=Plakobranchus ocellatus TaxID=259542 RepID=A0AAV4C8U7_9GAST|nr:hypothetical protein PoB_005443200 [Plakobranchus ocellatus]